MPKEKWLIDPSELDEFQKVIYDIGLDESFIIKGCAGSGKTILALFRAQEILIRSEIDDVPPSFTVVVFTKALSSFIRASIISLGIDIHQVVHYDKWLGDEVDHLIVDECQDFKSEEIDTLMSAKTESIMFYGDTQQQLYHDRLNLEELSRKTGLKLRELEKNYRLPKSIAEFVWHLGTDDKLRDKCMRPGFDKPRVLKRDNWQKEIDFIVAEIRARNYTDVAILLPFNNKIVAPTTNAGIRNVESVIEYLDNNSFSYEAKFYDSSNYEHDDLDFDSELPKLMTFHSSKGLQFETVFVPFCDYPVHDDWVVEHIKNPLFVALTRTYKNLYITHSGKLTQFFKKIPPHKYD